MAPGEKKEQGVHFSERYFGSFQRSVRLPTGVDSDNIKADFKNGVVRIQTPKSERSKTKKITIKGS